MNELYNNNNGCFKKFPELNKMNNAHLYIFGGMYGSKYVTAIAELIMKEGNKYNLKGIGLGDPFLNPEASLG